MLTRRIVARVGRESVPGTTAPHMLNLVLEGAQLPLEGTSTEMLPNERSSPFQHDNASMVTGLQRKSPVKLALVAKYQPSQLDAMASLPAAVTAAGALSQEVVLEHWLGGESVGIGSTVVSSADAHTVTVTAGQGSRFAAGRMGVFYVAGVGYPRQVIGVASDVVTVFPDLPASPATGQAILGTRSYHRAESHTQTLTVEAANYESGTPAGEQRALMTHGQCAWAAEIGARATLAFDGTSHGHDFGNLSIAFVDVADDMGADVVWQGETLLGPAADGASFDHICVEKMAVTVANGWRDQACLSAPQGVAGVVMTGGRTPPTLEITGRWDTAGADLTAAFVAGTQFSYLAYATRGSGADQRWLGWWFPVLAFDAEPTRVDMDGEVMVVAKFRALANTVAAGSPLGASSTDVSRSPVIHFTA